MQHNANELTEAIIGAAIEVHKELGPGYLESIYEEALAIELGLRQIPFNQQHPIDINYKGHAIGQSRLDLVIKNTIVLELKAVDKLSPIHTAQVISYLKAAGLKTGLIINFNVRVLKDGIQRVSL